MTEIDSEHVRALDGRLLLVFRALFETNSATGAAERLGLSQSAVSHSLSRLRQLHGDPLFTRLPHGLRPTRRALQLAPRIDALIELAGDLYRGPDSFDPARSERRFAIAAPEFVSATMAAGLIRRWSTVAPDVSLTMRQLDEGAVIDALTSGELDLAIGRFSARQPARIVHEELYQDEYCVVARRGHPTIDGSIDRSTYQSIGHVLAASASESRPGETVPKAIRVVAVVPAWLTALNVVAASDGVVTCPRRLAERHASPLGLQVMAVPGMSPSIDVAMLRRSGRSTPAVEWLRREVVDVIATN